MPSSHPEPFPHSLTKYIIRCGAAVSIPDSTGRSALVLYIGNAKEVNERRHALLSNVTQKPFWVPDDALKSCMECGADFSFSRRRHHCRHCGRLVCPSCSPKKIPIPKLLESKPVRVCSLCLKAVVSPVLPGQSY